MYPRIDSPCPLTAIQVSGQGNVNCALCEPEIHNFSAMDDHRRAIFLQQCSGEIYVSYKVKTSLRGLLKGALAGMFVVGASGLAVSVAADPADVQPSSQVSEIVVDDIGQDNRIEIVMVGGVHFPEKEGDEESAPLDESHSLQLIPAIEERDEQ